MIEIEIVLAGHVTWTSEVNAMTVVYALKLGFQIYRTNVGVQKIDGSTFETFKIVLANF